MRGTYRFRIAFRRTQTPLPPGRETLPAGIDECTSSCHVFVQVRLPSCTQITHGSGLLKIILQFGEKIFGVASDSGRLVHFLHPSNVRKGQPIENFVEECKRAGIKKRNFRRGMAGVFPVLLSSVPGCTIYFSLQSDFAITSQDSHHHGCSKQRIQVVLVPHIQNLPKSPRKDGIDNIIPGNVEPISKIRCPTSIQCMLR